MVEDVTPARADRMVNPGADRMADRETRRKALLKANMGRRKAQTRARAEARAGDEETADAADE